MKRLINLKRSEFRLVWGTYAVVKDIEHLFDIVQFIPYELKVIPWLASP